MSDYVGKFAWRRFSKGVMFVLQGDDHILKGPTAWKHSDDVEVNILDMDDFTDFYNLKGLVENHGEEPQVITLLEYLS